MTTSPEGVMLALRSFEARLSRATAFGKRFEVEGMTDGDR